MSKAIQLADGEEILVIYRRHWFPLAVDGFVSCVLFLLAFIVGGALAAAAADGAVLSGQQAFALTLFALSFFGLVLWLRFFALWSDHWLDAWIITDRRIIDIEQTGFFRRHVSSFPLDRIQDVTFSINGLIETWLHFGDVRIQTASISEDLIMKQVPFPEDVKERIVSLLDRYGTSR